MIALSFVVIRPCCIIQITNEAGVESKYNYIEYQLQVVY